MDKRGMSLVDRIREAFSDPDAPAKVEPLPEAGPDEGPATFGDEALAAAVAIAIHRARRGAATRSAAAPRRGNVAGADEWTLSGRLAQVDRAPGRDPWNR